MNQQVDVGRCERLAAKLAAQGADVFLASSAVSMGYLHGFGETGGERFLVLAVSRAGAVRLICPALSEAQARRTGITDICAWSDGEDPMDCFHRLAQDWSLRAAVIAVDDDMPASYLLAMQDALPAALFKRGSDILSGLMAVKGPQELEKMMKAAQIADESYLQVAPRLRPGMTELQVQAMLEAAMRERGGKPEFAIVAVGAASAEPHHQSGEQQIVAGDLVLMDFGCTVGGYFSDITRVVACGSASSEMSEIYRIVWRAHMAARSAAGIGTACGDVDHSAREVIAGAGFADRFVHRTGHGIGMRCHEPPYIDAGNGQLLEEGNCFSVEPGIYLPGKFGIRIENIVHMTGAGASSFNEEPAEELPVVAL